MSEKIFENLIKLKLIRKNFTFLNVFKPIALNLENVNQLLISENFEHSGKGFKYFIDYQDDNILRPLCIISPQISGYIF